MPAGGLPTLAFATKWRSNRMPRSSRYCGSELHQTRGQVTSAQNVSSGYSLSSRSARRISRSAQGVPETQEGLRSEDHFGETGPAIEPTARCRQSATGGPGTPWLVVDKSHAPMAWVNLLGSYSGGDGGKEEGGLICVTYATAIALRAVRSQVAERCA
jgi:hypothetical protein